MRRKIDGVYFVMRDKRPLRELRQLYQAFRAKYPTNTMTFHQWLVDRGKVSSYLGRAEH